MTTSNSVNVPPADLMLSFIARLDASPYSQHPMLLPLKPAVVAAGERIRGAIGVNEAGTAYEDAKLTTRAKDEVFDARHRFAKGVLEAFALHLDPDVARAARYVIDVLYPDGLTVINLSFELEAASGTTFEKRLAQPQVRDAVTKLAVHVPAIDSYLTAVVRAASELGQALQAFDGILVDKAGRPVNSALFEARTAAQRLFAQLLDTAETFAYPDDTPEHRQAREALAGPYRRFLDASSGRAQAPTEPTPAPTEPTA